MRVDLIKSLKAIQQWLKANRVMLVNTGSLIGTTGVTSCLGFAYWWVAARQFTPAAVGLGSANISTMMLLGGIGMVGLGTLLITELPRQPGQETSLISTGLVVVGIVGGIGGALFALVAPIISEQFSPLRANIQDVAIFALGVSLTAVSAVLDQALIGILQGNVQFWRNTLFSISKLGLLFLAGLYFAQKTGMTIYATWAISLGLSLVLLFFYSLFKTGWRGRAYLPQWKILRKLGPAALQHHLLNMILQVPAQLLPVVVTMLLTSQMNAWFYVSWMIAVLVFVIPNSLTMVLHAMNSADQSTLRQRAKMTMGIAFVATLVSVGVVFLAANLLLSLFGKIYADQATWCLRILVLAAFPAIIKNHFLSICRIQDRLKTAMSGVFAGGVLELAGAIVGAHLWGLLGLCGCWLFATSIQALYMVPVVYQMLWGKAKGEVLPADSIWLADTMMMPVLPLSRPTGNLQVRVPMTALREAEPVWLVDTIMQPVIRSGTSKLAPLPTTPAPVPSASLGQSAWLVDTIIQPAISLNRPKLGSSPPSPMYTGKNDPARTADGVMPSATRDATPDVRALPQPEMVPVWEASTSELTPVPRAQHSGQVRLKRPDTADSLADSQPPAKNRLADQSTFGDSQSPGGNEPGRKK